MPIFISHSAAPMPYGLPVPDSPLYKIGLHQSGPAADPDRQRQDEDAGLTARAARLAARHVPGYRPQPVRTERCIYDNTPDEDFIVDRAGRIVVGSGTSGHGFKFGPLLGSWLASLAAGDRACRCPVSRRPGSASAGSARERPQAADHGDIRLVPA